MRLRLFPPLLLLVASIAPAPARANGRFPATTNVRLHPSDEDVRLVATTFGLLLTTDGGATHRWVCETAIGYGGTYDPDYAVASDGSIYASTFDGLRVTRDGGCTWQLAGPPLDGLLPGAVEIAANGHVWVAATELDVNGVYVSDDNGVSFVRTALERERAWWHALAVAPTEPRRVFVSGYTIPGSTPDAGPGAAPALLYRSDDAGLAWTALPVGDFDFGDEPLVFVEAVSPTDADVVYARVRRSNPPNGDSIYRSIDAGASWIEVLDTADAVSAFVARADGQTVVVGTRFGGVRISHDRGDTWSTPPVEPQMGCLRERFDGALFACGGNWAPDFMALGRSADAESWQPVLAFADIAGPLQCEPGTLQFDECTVEQWPALAEQLGVGRGGDAGPDANDAGASIDAAPGPDAGGGGGGGGCGCSAGAAAVLFVWPWRRRRARR